MAVVTLHSLNIGVIKPPIDIAIHAMAGGLSSHKRDLFRLTIQTAALEGAIFVCKEPESQKIFSVGIAYGPGTDFLGR